MDKEELSQNSLKPKLKKKAILVKSLVGAAIFHDGTWWKIVHLNPEFEDTYVLQELTNEEMAQLLDRWVLIVGKDNGA